MIETFFRMGGFSMVPVLLLGLGALGVAVYASARPEERTLGLARRLGWSVLFFSLCGLLANVAATLHFVSGLAPDEDRLSVLCTGLYESTAPGIMGMAFLALTHLAIAVAAYRGSDL